MRPETLVKILRQAILIGILGVILITPFIVSSSMFFPFITGKNFFFRIAVEVLFAGWVVLAFMDRRSRPTRSPLLFAVGIFAAVLILSTIFSVNPYRSFWSNYERMEGLIGHLHLFAYFLVLVSVFKTDYDCRNFFYAATLAGAAMAFYGYLQASGVLAISQQSGSRVDGTFGNASYMAIFLVFQAFLAGYLALKEDRRLFKYLFAALFLFEVPVVFLTATRGAILGLVAGLALFAVLLGIFSQKRQLRVAAFSVIGGMVALVLVFWLIQDSKFIDNNYILVRFRHLSLSDRTVESRFTMWRMSWEGFTEHPVLGWGIENYNQVFNKYYNPVLWRQEAWFDRAHNVFFDWLITGGTLGFLAYASMFGSALYILWKVYLRDRSTANLTMAASITSLFAAYGLHNLFVFDNLGSYLLFYSVLGYVHFRYWNALPLWGGASEVTPRMPVPYAYYATVAVSVGIGLAGALYFLNIKPIQANTALLAALRDQSTAGQNVDLILSDFNKVFSYRTFGTGEAREQFSGYANQVASSGVPNESKVKAVSAALTQMELQVKENPQDARAYVFASALYSLFGRRQDAFNAVGKAIELSPKKQQFYFLLADMYLAMGQNQKAEEAIQTAYDFDTKYDVAIINLVVVSIITGNSKHADEVLKEAYGTLIVPNQQFVAAYTRVGNYARVRDIWLEFIKQEPKNVQYRVSLAATYVKLGERERAVQTLQKAMGLDPSFRTQGESIIQEIRAGKNF